LSNKVIAVVPAAGLGKRFGEGTNKPLIMLGAKPLVIWAVEALQNMPEIGEIIPVVKEADIELCGRLFQEYSINKIKQIIPGGRERQDSVFNGLKYLDGKGAVVLVHDGVRPFVDISIVKNALQELKDCDGVVVGVPLKDTVKEVRNCVISKTPDRDLLWAVQTPQVFHYEPLFNAYEKAMADSIYTTDDSALVERNGGTVKVIMGSYMNIKVTTPEDLLIAEVFRGIREGGV
jgi:2-C-methyl-D-erythritol 4-phosphate cytidylyltransferase